jgi:hypothetical protein
MGSGWRLNGEIQIAQADVYYGYCLNDGIDEYCYWYPATDVVVTDTWIFTLSVQTDQRAADDCLGS